MEHKFHNHSLRKNNLMNEELKIALDKIEKQKQDKLIQIQSKSDKFRRLHSRQYIKRSLDSCGDCSTPNSKTTIKRLEIMKDSKRFVSEPNLFANRRVIFDRKPTFPFVEPNRCLSYRKLQLIHNNRGLTSSSVSVSLDSGIELFGSNSSLSDGGCDSSKSNDNNSVRCHSPPILAFPLIAHHDYKQKPSRAAKLCFYKAMGNRITSDNGWKYLMTNVFKRLNESSYRQESKEDCHDAKDSMDNIAMCRYLRLPVKYQTEPN